jgi:hypothetical protein
MSKNKKADVDKHPARAVVHVGLLFDEPPGIAETPFAKSSVTSYYKQFS